MKVVEFTVLSDDEKVALMPDDMKGSQITTDKATCALCGHKCWVDCWCFGCHKYICKRCIRADKHECAK